VKVANTREGNVGRHTLSQNLGPLYRLQGCGGVDRQCDFEIFCHSTQVVIKTSEMAKHIDIVQCEHPTYGKKNVMPDALSRRHQLKVVYVGETKLRKEVN
jgi:hypothetical protein